MSFGALKDIKFLLPHSDMMERFEVKHSVMSSLQSCDSCREGLLLNDDDSTLHYLTSSNRRPTQQELHDSKIGGCRMLNLRLYYHF